MQKGKYMLSDRQKSNTFNSFSMMKECSDLEKEKEAYFKALPQRKAEQDEAIVSSYWAKKEELEQLYKMRDSAKKQSLIKAKKEELDGMYTKYVCIRKAVYSFRQENRAIKTQKALGTLRKDLYNLAGRVMSEREYTIFMTQVKGLIPVEKVMTNDGGWEVGFEVDGLSYYAVRTKRGFRWEVSL